MKFKFIVLILLCIDFTYAGSFDDAVKLDNKSTELLGIGLVSISYLLKADERSYLPKEYYEQSDDYEDIKKLEEMGYITIEIVNKLPDGAVDQSFMQLLPTEKGHQVKNAIMRKARK